MQKVWLNSYPKDVPAEINIDEKYHSLVDIFKEVCQVFSDKPAYANLGHILTYRDVEQQAKVFAAFLQQQLKLEKGARVAIMMPNLLQYPVALFGVLLAGCIVVNVNPLYTPRELAHQLKDAEAETIIVLANFSYVLEKALPEIPIKHIIVTEVGDSLPYWKRKFVNFVVKTLQRKVPAFNLPQAFSFQGIFSKFKPSDFKPLNLELKDIAFLQYTGGTTGISKGAILTHKNMMANLFQVKAWVKNYLREKDEIMIGALPLYHVFSLTVNFLNFFVCGGLTVLITNPRDIKGFIKTLKKYPFTIMTGVNTLFNALLNQPEFKNLDFSHLHVSLGGGMAVQESVAEQWQKMTGKPLSEGYGLTEASPVVTINPLDLNYFNGSIGLPVSSTEVSIRDEYGTEVEIGKVGELWVKGPQIMEGYWHNPTETQNAITPDGWLKTGDLVTIDEKGFIRIVDRKKDMILVSGFNVYPNEVENIVASCPGVLEAAVIGEPVSIVGETVKAFVVRKNPKLTAEEIIQYCRKYLTGYKIPRIIEFRDTLPKNTVGKILRRELKKTETVVNEELNG